MNEKSKAARRALIIGDSISIGYMPIVAELLSDWGTVEHNPGNALYSANILTHLDEWLGDGKRDVIQFNAGLHDIRRMPPQFELLEPLESYAANLSALVHRLRAATDARLIWASTTPVIDERHQALKEWKRFQRDVEAYNAAAQRVMNEMKVPINDLHGVVQKHGAAELLLPDGVHYGQEGSRILGEAVASGIVNRTNYTN